MGNVFTISIDVSGMRSAEISQEHPVIKAVTGKSIREGRG